MRGLPVGPRWASAAGFLGLPKGAIGSRVGLSKSTPACSARVLPSCSFSTLVRISSTSPTSRSPSWKGPKETRISRFTERPRCSRMRLTSRFLPSRRPSVSQMLSPCARSRCASTGPYSMPSMVTPLRSLSSSGCVISPKARTRYFRSQPVSGCATTLARPPSLVRSSSPSVLMSSRPTATTRGRSSGRTSKTVCRPSGSRAVVTTPRGLCRIQSRVRSRAGSGSPSTVMRSSSVTLIAGEVRAFPFRLTRPASIIASASRREAMPARAMALAMRSPSGVAGIASSPCGGSATPVSSSGMSLMAAAITERAARYETPVCTPASIGTRRCRGGMREARKRRPKPPFPLAIVAGAVRAAGRARARRP
ncbi:hypothetical protein MMMDOFMJ_2079 [Methylobacterium gnaphalii]|nr:hypothetical protein MMMDOFMJ_2079 [Methylobacterium gnaphalii]